MGHIGIKAAMVRGGEDVHDGGLSLSIDTETCSPACKLSVVQVTSCCSMLSCFGNTIQAIVFRHVEAL